MNFANFVDLAAQRVPSERAAGDAKRCLTYAELSRETNAAAAVLETLGVAPGDRVAVCLDNQLEFLTAYLGAMKRGAVPVPVNTQFNDEQIQYVLNVSDASVIVTDESFKTVARKVETGVTVDGSAGRDYRTLLDASVDDYAVHPRRSDEVAAVVFTSGTTGRPKGVRHTHGNVLANAMAIIAYHRLTGDDVGLTACQCFHVTGLNVTTTPLLAAEAENHLLAEWTPESALETIEDCGVTYTFLTPNMVSELIEFGAVDEYDLSSLEIVGVGGAPMPTGQFDRAEATLGCTVLEGYGMTETTPLAAFNRPDPEERKRGSVGPVAREAVDLRIEDLETGEAVVSGERGELLWRGDTVSPGYERRQNDAGAFVERDGTRWFRSGDIGWLDEDDHLFIVDRCEDMFTTGCANVYPREIEDTLYELDGVMGAAVIDARDDRRGAVVTAIVKRASDNLTEEQVCEVCEAHLKEHEVPQRVEFAEEIPTTVTGKVDRRALRDAFGRPSTC